MNGFLLLIPFLLIRFGVLSHLDRAAVKRAAFFAPMAGKEIAAYWIYQLSNAAIFIVLIFPGNFGRGRCSIFWDWFCALHQ